MFFFRSPDNNLVPFTSPLTTKVDIAANPIDKIGKIYCGDYLVWRGTFANTHLADAEAKLIGLREYAAKIVEKTFEKHESGFIIDFKRVEGFYL